jgi:Domain of unknown function (DUF4190)
MSAGSFETGSDQPGPDAQPGFYAQPGHHNQPAPDTLPGPYAQPGPHVPPGPYAQPASDTLPGPYAQPGPYAEPGYLPPPLEGARAEYAQAEYAQAEYLQQPAHAPAGQFGPVSPQFQHDYAIRPRRTNSLAIAALSCGIGQLVAGPLSGVPAIVLGAMSLRQIRDTGEDGHAMAVTGLVLGIVGTVLFVVGVALVIAFAVFAFHQVGSAGGTG